MVNIGTITRENGSVLMRFEMRKTQRGRLRNELQPEKRTNRVEAEDQVIRRYSQFVIEY